MRRWKSFPLGLLTVAMVSGCDATMTDPLVDGVITGLFIRNVEIDAGAPYPCIVGPLFQMELRQNGTVFQASVLRNFDSGETHTQWLRLVSGDGLNPREPVSITFQAVSVQVDAASGVFKVGEIPPPHEDADPARCRENLLRTWTYQGPLTDEGSRAYSAPFSSFVEGSKRGASLFQF